MTPQQLIDLAHLVGREWPEVQRARVVVHARPCECRRSGTVTGLRAQIHASAPCASVRPPLVRMARKSSNRSNAGLRMFCTAHGSVRTSLGANTVSLVYLPVRAPRASGDRLTLARFCVAHKASISGVSSTTLRSCWMVTQCSPAAKARAFSTESASSRNSGFCLRAPALPTRRAARACALWGSPTHAVDTGQWCPCPDCAGCVRKLPAHWR